MPGDGLDCPLPTSAFDWANPVPTTAVTPKDMDVLYALHRLSNGIARFIAKAITDGVGADRWLELADLLVDAARMCRKQATVDGQG